MGEYMKPLDYVIFAAVLLVSLGIGIFYSFSQTKSSEYLQGQRQLGVLPVGISLAVSTVSAISLQGVSAETFLYGVETFFLVPDILAGILAIFTFVPLFYPLNLTSVYEYFSRRFITRAPRLMAVTLDVAGRFLYLGAAVLAPAQALESMLGMSLWLNIILLIGICTIYTALGGIKAVVWADVFQSAIMILGLLLVLIMGCLHFDPEFDFHAAMKKRGRLDFHPFARSSLLAYLSWIFYRFHLYQTQYCLMRYNSVRTLRQAKMAVLVAQLFTVLTFALSTCAGLVMFRYYAQKGCDPLASGQISSPNQILPHFVVNVLNYPCIPGLFASAITASALSTVSSLLNSLCAVAWTEIFSLKLAHISDHRKTVILKITVVGIGLITLATAFIAEHLGGTLMQITSTAKSVTGVGTMSLFVLSATLAFAGPTACICGSAIGVGFVMWIAMGRIFHGTVWQKPQLINDSCQSMNDVVGNWSTSDSFSKIMNNTTVKTITEQMETGRTAIEYLYSISPYMYMLFGISLALICTLLLSLIPALRMTTRVDGNVLFPCLRRVSSKSSVDGKPCIGITTVKEELNHTTEKNASGGSDSSKLWTYPAAEKRDNNLDLSESLLNTKL